MVIMVGGSGLYVDSVLKGLDEFPIVNSEIRDVLNLELATSGIEILQKELKELDPKSYDSIELKNPQRLIRALEICRGTKQPYSSFLKNKKIKRGFKTISIGLKAERSLIYERINSRVDNMIINGLLEEAKSVFKNRTVNALNTVGYKQLFNYFDGKWTLEFAVSEIKKNTRRFAKRQLTWFQKNENIHWFEYNTDPENIVNYLKKELKRTS
jgi:tRNA dimethylallyltransferase